MGMGPKVPLANCAAVGDRDTLRSQKGQVLTLRRIRPDCFFDPLSGRVKKAVGRMASVFQGCLIALFDDFDHLVIATRTRGLDHAISVCPGDLGCIGGNRPRFQAVFREKR
jgi:hypothetical protein